MVGSEHSFRVCLIDMNNGVANQATRCFRRLFDAFQKRVKQVNPSLDVSFRHVQPRNLGELPDDDVDLVLSSGGPGAPYDGFEDPWCMGYRKFLDRVVEQNLADPKTAPKALVVCHSFEIAVLHFKVAEMVKRPTLKFGVMPAYITEQGQEVDYLTPFGYRLFTWEHRNWEAVNVDAKRLAELGGSITALESHAKAKVNTGDAILGMHFAPGVQGTQFHPEADKPGVMAWIEKPEHTIKVEEQYGRPLYEKMITTLSNPDRLARTFALLIPGWLAFRFNEIAEQRGLRPISAPEFDIQEFDIAV
jgi:GMP synthase-like glutamine amidotransferase